MTAGKTTYQIDDTITRAEFMQRFHISSRTTFHKWKRAGVMKTIKVGREVMIPVSEVARLMKENTRHRV
jgi:predicted site-specific integrase-resolvase